MSKRYDVCTPRPKKDGGTFWHRVGVAFDGDKGITLYLDSSPYPDKDGRVALMLFEPRPKNDAQGFTSAEYKAAHDGGGAPADLDTEIPFAPEFR